MWWIIGIVTYVVGFVVTAGAMQAYWERAYPGQAEEMYRDDMALSVGVAMVPIIGWIVVLFFTGFHQHGWVKFRVRPSKRQPRNFPVDNSSTGG